MALVAMTTADVIKYVSDLDPAKKKEQVPVDENDASKGLKTVETIDWEKATVFHLRPLDVYLMGYIYDSASVLTGKQGSEEVGIHTRVNKTNIDAVRFGLARIDNFKDGHGQLIRFKTQNDVVNGREYEVAHDDIMNSLGVKLISELANKIKEISEVSKAEEKNSEQASPQSG